MIIAVASAGRAGKVLTLQKIWPKEWVDRTYLVVPESQKDDYKNDWPNIVTHPNINRLSPTRDFINDHFGGHVLHADDDSLFYTRLPKLHHSTTEDLAGALEWFEQQMNDGIVYAGMGFRFMSQDREEVQNYPPGISNFYAVNTETLRSIGFRFSQTELLQGLNLAVTMARLGYATRMLYKVVYHQPTVNADGGCSTYRTGEMYDNAVKAFQAIHGEEYITIRRRAVNWQGMEGERNFIRVQWQRIKRDIPQVNRAPGKATSFAGGSQAPLAGG